MYKLIVIAAATLVLSACIAVPVPGGRPHVSGQVYVTPDSGGHRGDHHRGDRHDGYYRDRDGRYRDRDGRYRDGH